MYIWSLQRFLSKQSLVTPVLRKENSLHSYWKKIFKVVPQVSPHNADYIFFYSSSGSLPVRNLPALCVETYSEFSVSVTVTQLLRSYIQHLDGLPLSPSTHLVYSRHMMLQT